MSERDEDERIRWLRASPQERMEALEQLRALHYGYAEDEALRPRFQKIYRVVDMREDANLEEPSEEKEMDAESS
jgi:hypothetical protein